jgi:ADP-ribosylglycohydrolase/tetratricopeptide (TPR) repeat protein
MSANDFVAVPLVDRQAELGRLDAIAAEVLDREAGRLVIVGGNRGAGKSRVVEAFAERCRATKMTVLKAACVGRHAEPLLPIRDALREVLGTTAQEVRDAFVRSAPELLGGVPVIGRFLAGFGRELAAGPQIGGENARGLYDLLASVMLGLGKDAGLCLIVEDGHVADADTLNFVTYLLSKSRSSHALIVVSLPTEERQDPALSPALIEWEERGADVLTVGPLERPDVREYLRRALARDDVEDSTLDFMVAFTGGNALLLAEASRSLAGQENAIERLADDAAEIPERIQRLLHGRLERLGPEVRSFVDAAAVVGQTAKELPPLLHVVEVDDRGGIRLLEQACSAGVLQEDEQGLIGFTSELFHRVTDQLLRPNQRRLLHLHAGEWFEQEHRSSEAAHHYRKAGDWERFVPAALSAAEAAEHLGLYQSAVNWYRDQDVKDRADVAELFPRLARALLVVGEWDDASRLLDALPSSDPRTELLRSRLCFVRGDVTGAAAYAKLGLGGDVASENVEALLQLAKIDLYRGEFEQAEHYADQALEAARRSGSLNDQACAQLVHGACHLYNGDLSAAEQAFEDGLWLLETQPAASRDLGIYSALLGNRGYVEELLEQWTAASRSHDTALHVRREVADAVGILESTLAIGRVAIGTGELAVARGHLGAARTLAQDLGEGLQHAKVIHAMGEVAAHDGNLETARDLVTDARHRFVACGTPYDVAYTDLSLARILLPVDPRGALEHRATARTAAEGNGFRLLWQLFPELGPALPERIHAGLLAYAAGDALGLPWEGKPPQEVRLEAVDQLPAGPDWPAGSTSDDTAITLLVAEHLAAAGGVGDPRGLLEAIASGAASIPGLGPSTRRAVVRFTTSGRLEDDSDANTNGGAMRALPIGWTSSLDRPALRREWTSSLTRVTHGGADAVAAARVMAACASWAIEGASTRLLIEIAAEEAALVGAGTNVAHALARLLDGTWEPPSGGITLAPDETVAAVLYSCDHADGDLLQALRAAVQLGGDTDTVAALVGGLMGCRLAPDEVRSRLAWIDRVELPPIDDLARLGRALADIRGGHDE